mmetsp:Transcript_83247/g.147079  ORF Transcript_83247/g.147079 Transcript_83247/m.147079 type:complete len:233 (-) Transcript_83247:1410-2108(-)
MFTITRSTVRTLSSHWQLRLLRLLGHLLLHRHHLSLSPALKVGLLLPLWPVLLHRLHMWRRTRSHAANHVVRWRQWHGEWGLKGALWSRWVHGHGKDLLTIWANIRGCLRRRWRLWHARPGLSYHRERWHRPLGGKHRLRLALETEVHLLWSPKGSSHRATAGGIAVESLVAEGTRKRWNMCLTSRLRKRHVLPCSRGLRCRIITRHVRDSPAAVGALSLTPVTAKGQEAKW